jgi:hypothetical protein
MDSLIAFATARAATLRVVAPLSQEQIDFTPAPRKWSVGEILDHLLLAEALYRDEIAGLVGLKRAGKRAYVRRSFGEINVSPFGLPDVVLSWLTVPFTAANVFIPGFLRDLMVQYAVLPVRNPGRTTPRGRRPAPELRAELLSSLAATRRLISSNADLDFRELVSEHPLTGANTVPGIFSFLASHERRHQTQIRRVRSARGFPLQ